MSSAPGDNQCVVGAATTGAPGALLRGETFSLVGVAAGPLAIDARLPPAANGLADPTVGVRCAR